MARVVRKTIFEETKYVHILLQGINKEYIFKDIMLKNFFLKCCSENMKTYEISILSFCIMGNHAHLLIITNKVENLSNFIKKISIIFAKYYNKTKKRVGYVFRDRYRSEPIKDEEYLLNCISYIHNNPVKAKIVDVSENYEFSSAKNFQTREGIIDFEKLKEIFGRVPKTETHKNDSNFLDDQTEDLEVLEELIKRYNITSKNSLQNDDLLAKISVELKKRTGKSLREIANLLEVGRERVRLVVSKHTTP